jgi:lipopolysaccharide export system permease protein
MFLKLIDRQMIRGYFKAYFVCLISLLSLYIVVDLFTNLDDFTKHHKRLLEVLKHILTYYGYQVPQIFDRLCEVIVLLAAMFTVAWMQRNNEQIPLLSAGVSTRRIVAPVLACACIMLFLTILNQELLLSRIAPRLTLARDDPQGDKELTVQPVYDRNGLHFHGEKANRKTQSIHNLTCSIPAPLCGNLGHLTAKEAHYLPDANGRDGIWELTGTKPAELEEIPNILEPIDTGRCLLHTHGASFEAMTRARNWFQLASTYRLYQELQDSESTRLAPIAVLFHMRLTRPILGIVLVFLGLSVILRDQNRNVVISSGMCLVLCAVFFATIYACKMLGDGDYLSPTLAAWLPVLCFGPHALVLFDAVHT